MARSRKPRKPAPADTDAARGLPSVLTEEEALRGFWPRFPVSPEPFAEDIEETLPQRDFYTAGASSSLASRLDDFVARAETLTKRKKFAEALGLLRALMTVIIELMDHADDSYGSLGGTFRAGFKVYLAISPASAQIDDRDFLHDLLGLLIWEDYGLTDDQTNGYFARLSKEQGDCCVEFLQRHIADLAAEHLTYQSEQALTLLGQVAAEQDRFDQFEDLARRMGSREWQRIVRLVDRAVKKRKRELAVRVFEAALTPGPHQGFLARKFEKLRQGHWSPDPRK
jgi:hypothetical protein